MTLKMRSICLGCHDFEQCQREHVGHPGICEICGRDTLVTFCSQVKPATPKPAVNATGAINR